MKISNETKVGAVAVVSVTLLILGFNFLKGKKLFSSSKDIIARFENVHGLTNSNPVMVNGLQVGTVYSLSPSKDMRQILVTLNITSDIDIPANSVATIKPSLLGVTSLDITLGNATTFLKHKDSISTIANTGTLDNILKKVDPVLFEVTKAISSIDSFLKNLNHIIDPRAKNNIGATLENLNKITGSLTHSASSLEAMLNTQTGTVSKTLNNLNSVSGNLAANNDKVTGVLTNLDKTTSNLSELDLKATLESLNATIGNLKNLVGKMNDDNGTIGLLLNDPSLYKNLASTANKLNLLIDDIRVNPKRYVNISVIGKKNSSAPLSQPLPDTLNSPYIIEKAKN